MSSIVNFDRDLDWLDLSKANLTLANQVPFTGPDFPVGTDGMPYGDVAIGQLFTSSSFTFPAADDVRSAGVYMIGPDITGGSPYRIHGYAFEQSGEYTIRLMFGIVPNSGNIIISPKPILAFKDYSQFDKTVYIPAFEESFPGQGYSESSICFFVMYHRDNTSITTISCGFRLSVQRLSVKPPAYITANR